ncbi:CLUMA_CG008031, isoform A [Clunio marinus]|uniref:CLUMA_CG008031, isoform A n=1 Tax=Clunio marinus TaxID=568069 RepID=A0A1J1I2J6_9DIPT|nr:CLUMA_CG008031, isoform A [Clunio marinus]
MNAFSSWELRKCLKVLKIIDKFCPTAVLESFVADIHGRKGVKKGRNLNESLTWKIKFKIFLFKGHLCIQ